jgi:hypothetical protein
MSYGDGSDVAFEIRNDISGPGGPMGDLIISNYRMYALVSTRARCGAVSPRTSNGILRKRMRAYRIPLFALSSGS